MLGFKFTIATSEPEIKEAKRIRNEVFVLEQGIPEELDSDVDDGRSIHLLVSKGPIHNQFIGSGRLTINGNEGVLSRICVIKLYRKEGIGKMILIELERIASENGVQSLSLTPHVFLENFYEKLGYKNIQKDKVVGSYKLLTMVKWI